MLDTLMVLWTRGKCGRFVQTLAAFLLLFLGICALLLLVTASGVKWPGLAVTAAPPIASVTAGATATATPASHIVPLILQNPTPRATNLPRGATKRAEHHRYQKARLTPTPVMHATPGDQAIFP
jgi:hypothetical protein